MTEPNKRSQRWAGWVTVTLVVYWVAMFIGTHVPSPDLGDVPAGSDKVLHFGAYGGLAFLLGLRIALRTGRFRKLDAAIVFGITIVYSIIDELLQMIPVLRRTADFYDILADAVGSLCGLAALAVIVWWYRRRSGCA